MFLYDVIEPNPVGNAAPLQPVHLKKRFRMNMRFLLNHVVGRDGDATATVLLPAVYDTSFVRIYESQISFSILIHYTVTRSCNTSGMLSKEPESLTKSNYPQKKT